MDVEVYQYLMSRSGVGSTGAGLFISPTARRAFATRADRRSGFLLR